MFLETSNKDIAILREMKKKKKKPEENEITQMTSEV